MRQYLELDSSQKQHYQQIEAVAVMTPSCFELVHHVQTGVCPQNKPPETPSDQVKFHLWKLVLVATQQPGNDIVHLLNTSACGCIALWSVIVLLEKKLYNSGAELTQEPLRVTN